MLEQHTLGWGASGRNGGFVLPGYKPEMEELDRRLGSERAARMFQLTLEAMRFLEQLITEERIDCDFAHSGAVTLAAKPGHMRGLEESGRFMRERLGYETELDDQNIRKVERRLLAALFPPESQQGLLVLAHDHPGIGAADKLAAVMGYHAGWPNCEHSSAVHRIGAFCHLGCSESN